MQLPDWVISDTHFNHRNINEFAKRTTPMFPEPDDVDDVMRHNWTRLVKPSDTILHLGDLGYFDLAHVQWLHDLPGIKLFVRGNHDKESPDWLANHGFEEIDAPTYEMVGMKVLCTHYPQDDLPADVINVHGHTHNNPEEFTNLQHANVSVERWAFAPVAFTWLVQRTIGRLDLPSRIDRGPVTIKYGAKRSKR